MSAWNLASFPSHILADITQWLYSEDVLALYSSGDRFLQAKMSSGGVTELHHFSDNAEVPSLVQYFGNHLDTFKLSGSHELFASELTQKEMLKLPTSITSLQLDAELGDLSVLKHFTELRSLTVQEIHTDEDIPTNMPPMPNLSELKVVFSSAPNSLLQALSRSLTSIDMVSRPSHRLHNSYLASEDPDAWPELVSLSFRLVTPVDLPHFPRNLTRLHLQSGVYKQGSHSEVLVSPWSLLPPGIVDFLYGVNTIEMRPEDALGLNRSMTKLSLRAMKYVGFSVETMQHLPRTLERLILRNSTSYALRFDGPMLAALPPNLRELSASFAPYQLTAKSLPSGLEAIEFGSFCPGTLETLPSSLTTILSLKSNQAPSELLVIFGDHCAKLTILHLELVNLAPRVELPSLPETLTDLRFITPAGWIANLNCMPKSLQKLEMRLATTTAFPPGDWFQQLPYEKLEFLKIPTTRFTRQQVSYLHRCEQLKTVILAVDFYGTDFLDLLPKQVEVLDVTCVVTESWQAIREKLPTTLRSLKIRLHASDHALPAPGAEFGKLPHRLREFEVYHN